jgi:hypothetical protein
MPKRRRWSSLLLLVLWAGHLAVSFAAIWELSFLRTYTWKLLKPFLFFPIEVAADFGLWPESRTPLVRLFILYVVVPLNSLAYAAVLAGVASTVRIAVFRRTQVHM